ncbi:MAG: type III-A CRISPR-associated protein Cas10/Csm1 [Lewinellaceae bacterium]|nr:type III-A CRISPR-associated protein Cas10/Csm1 [Saprospiraceae bacterium]MCB9338546.1 type III-A CRISPR-associated protein Cas10/Csm1 [Lewinellaceae bacterium]
MAYISYYLHTLSKYSNLNPTSDEVDQNVLQEARTLSLGDPNLVEKAAQLFPVLGKASDGNGKYFPSAPLNIWQDESVFPGQSPFDFDKLSKGFNDKAETLDQSDPSIYIENLLSLTRQYYSHVAASPDAPFVSIHDHCRLVAAAADCLERTDDKDKPYLLVAAGLDGIQAFCYDVVRNKASKSIKGRSFYLQVLMDVLVQRIVFDKRIEATTGHVLLARGGKLRILLPNKKEIRNALKDIETEVQQLLFEKLQMTLSLHMVYDFAFSKDQLFDQNIWDSLENESIAHAKRKPFINLLSQEFDNLFRELPEEISEEEGVEIGAKTCSVTGAIIPDPKDYNILNLSGTNEEQEERIYVLKYIRDIAMLGGKLQDKSDQLYYITPGVATRLMKTNDKGQSIFEQCLEQAIEHGLQKESELKSNIVEGTFIKDFNNFKIPVQSSRQNLITGGIFYGGAKQAVLTDKNNRPIRLLEFNELAEFKMGSGFTRLGVLRMDVDGLGKFLNSLFNVRKGLGIYTAIAAQLDEFFNGYINKVRDEHPHHLNVLFSGGDDLMAVGKWNDIMTFAKKIRDSFIKYTGGEGNSPLTMSAGISLVNPTYPISKANQHAADALQKAKDFPDKDKPTKDAICIFGLAVSWEEWEQVEKWKTELYDYVNNNIFSASLLQMLQQFHEIKEKHIKDATQHTKPDLSFLWTSAYYITRYQSRVKKNELTAHDFLMKVKLNFFTAIQDDCRYFDLMAMAARWAELELRAEKEHTSTETT